MHTLESVYPLRKLMKSSSINGNVIMEGGHVVDSVSRIRSGYEYGRSPWSYSYGNGHVVKSVSRIRIVNMNTPCM